MKKDFIFAPILLVLGIVLGLLKVTGMIPHIIVSVVGTLVLIAYTVLTIKEWKLKPLEIAYRASYGIALIPGIILKAGVHALPLSIVHKVTAILFVVLLVATIIHKIIVTKRK